MILPSHRPDETLCSLLARMARLNGITDFRDLAEAFFGEALCTSFIDARIHLPTLCIRLREVYGDPISVIERFTWLGARVRLGEVESSWLNTLANGDGTIQLGDLTFQNEAMLGYCPTCVQHDVDRFGVAYWHRLHQLSIVRCCPEHGDWIRRIKIKRSSLHCSFPLPGDFISNEDSSEAAVAVVTRRCQELAYLAFLALHCTWPFEISIARLALERELRTCGLLDKKGKVIRKELAIWLYQGFCEEGDTHKQLVSQIVRSFNGRNTGDALCRVALIYLMFGSWAFFEERCRWETALRSDQGERSGAISASVEADEMRREQYRKNCIEFIETNSSPTRHNFIRTEYRSFRWLLRNDKEWLDFQLPILYQSPVQLTLF